MRKYLLFLFIVLFVAGVLPAVYGQADRFAYAVTDVKKEGTTWTMLRKLNLKTGDFTDILLDGSSKNTPLFEVSSRKIYEPVITEAEKAVMPQFAFGNGVAAIAYDRKNNRIFYTPMNIDQLRYVDLVSMKVYCVTGESFTNSGQLKIQPASALSRMVIAGDGYGYTVTNDGNHLFRFSTDEKPTITDLGALTDASVNNDMTIHNNACANSGGDLVADDDGNLYLFTSQNRIYKIEIKTLKATYLGKIAGLPEKFTSNGAAVDDEGNVLLSSSVFKGSYFKVNPATWKAAEFVTANGTYNSSDLANSNLLVTRKTTRPGVTPFSSGNISLVRLYPNPTQSNQFMVNFTNMEPGKYSVQVADLLGRFIMEKVIGVNSGSHTESVRFSSIAAKGTYFIKVTDHNNKQVFVEKLVVMPSMQ